MSAIRIALLYYLSTTLRSLRTVCYAEVMNKNYCNIPFTTETQYADFYTYANVKNLTLKCEISKEEIVKCRTVGILQSQHGKFLLADIDASGIQSDFKIRISMAYLKSSLQSTVIPYPVQVFGTLQWKNGPVIFAKIIQVLNIPMAIRIRDIMNTIAAGHLATSNKDSPPEELA